MASPFPGMDPYVEGRDLWPDAHHRLISEVDTQLQPQLNPRGYYISIESRIWLERTDRAIVTRCFRASETIPASDGRADRRYADRR